MIVKLALQNLLRNRKRSLTTILTVTFGVFVIVFLGSLLNGMASNWARLQIEATTGAMHIEHKAYRDNGILEPLATTIENGDELIERLQQVPGVISAYGKLRVTGVISSGSKSTVFDGGGVDIEGVAKTLPLADDLIVKGRSLERDLSEIVLGEYLAAELELEIGDPVIVAVRTYNGVLDLMYGKLVGIKNGPHFPASTYVEMNLAQAQRLLRMDGRLSQIALRISDQNAVDPIGEKVVRELESMGVNAAIRKYPELIQNYSTVTTSMKTVSYILGVIFLIIVGGGIANMMYMTVRERQKEIGTIMAIGMKSDQIRRLFILEGGYIGLIGAVIGIVIANLLVMVVIALGGIPIKDNIVFQPIVDPNNMFAALLIALIISVLATLLPASLSTKLDPVECLNEH